jgi:hypothetical protein
LDILQDALDALGVATLQVAELLGDRRLDPRDQLGELASNGGVDPSLELCRELARRPPAERFDVRVQRGAQAVVFRARVPLQWLVDEAVQGTPDALLEQIASFAAGDAKLGDALLEQLAAASQLIERQCDGVGLEARGLRGLRGHAAGQPCDGPHEQRLTLAGGRQLVQALPKRGDPVAVASADREQLDLLAGHRAGRSC